MNTDKETTEETQDELVDIWDVEVEEEEVENEIELDEEEVEEEEEVSEETEIEEEEVEEETSETEEIPQEDIPLVQSIQNILGYEFEDEFEDTDEGIAQMFEAAKNKAADEALNSLLEQYPEAKDLIEYRELGGDPDKFFQARFPDVDYTKVEFKDDDERQHEMLVRDDLRKKGFTDKEINADIEDFKNGGILESKAKRALESLKLKQKEEEDTLLEKQREQYEQKQEEINQYWDSVKQTIDKSTTFKSFNVPAKDKQKFFDYISKPVKDNKSQRDLDVENSDLETQLAVDFLLYKGFNINDIVERKAKDINAKTLRQRAKKAKLNKRQEKSQPEYTEELETI